MYFSRHLSKKLSSEDIEAVVRLCCIRHIEKPLCLSIGAPSSPILSNLIMHKFDSVFDQLCKSKGIIYTRYADDITLSTNIRELSIEFKKEILSVIRKSDCPKLELNHKKTIHLSRRTTRRVTLVITNDARVSLGRKKKRIISSLIHKYSIAIISQDRYLQGQLGFAKDVEPDFYIRMTEKYGAPLVKEILSLRKPSRRNIEGHVGSLVKGLHCQVLNAPQTTTPSCLCPSRESRRTSATSPLTRHRR